MPQTNVAFPAPIQMPFSEIRPFVRYVQLLDISHNEYPVFRRPYDCRLFYVYRGEGKLFVEDKVYHFRRGDLAVWQPGTMYHMDTDGEKTMQFLAVNFDYVQRNKEKDYPIPPDCLEQFDGSSMLPRVAFTDLSKLNEPLYLSGMQQVEDALLEMKREYQTKRVYYRERLSGLLLSMLGQLARKISLGVTEQTEAQQKIEQVIAYIQEHYQEDITNESIGALFNYHPNYLNKQMVLYTEKSLHQYLIACRIARAIDLIIGTNQPISEIASEVGFHDIPHFSKLFKQKTGSSPSDFRRASH